MAGRTLSQKRASWRRILLQVRELQSNSIRTHFSSTITSDEGLKTSRLLCTCPPGSRMVFIILVCRFIPSRWKLTHSIGPACGYALFSREGIHCITETLGPNKLQDLMQDASFCEKVTWGGLETFLRSFPPNLRDEPPPKIEDARVYIQCMY